MRHFTFENVIDYVTGLLLEDVAEVWLGHVTYNNDLCHICMSHVPHAYVMGLLLEDDTEVWKRHTSMNHVTYTNESCHI